MRVEPGVTVEQQIVCSGAQGTGDWCTWSADASALTRLLRSQIAFTVNPSRDAPSLLLRAAEQLEPLRTPTAPRDVPGRAAVSAGRLAVATEGREYTEAARRAPVDGEPSCPVRERTPRRAGTADCG